MCSKLMLRLFQMNFSGLKTALIEGDDFASGTSSRSTKLIHGGVRYLQKAILGVCIHQFHTFNFKFSFLQFIYLMKLFLLQADVEQYRMVKEALHERASMLHSAPHLTHPIPIMLPVYK